MPTKTKSKFKNKLKYMQKGGNDDAPNYSLNALLFVCFIGMIIRFFFSAPTSVDGASGPVTAAIWGYGLCAISLFFLMFLTYGLIESGGENLDQGAGDFIGGLLSSGFLVMIVLLIWVVSRLPLHCLGVVAWVMCRVHVLFLACGRVGGLLYPVSPLIGG